MSMSYGIKLRMKKVWLLSASTFETVLFCLIMLMAMFNLLTYWKYVNGWTQLVGAVVFLLYITEHIKRKIKLLVLDLLLSMNEDV